MKLGLINSAWVRANRPTSFGLEMTKKIGFSVRCLFSMPLPYSKSNFKLSRVRKSQ